MDEPACHLYHSLLAAGRVSGVGGGCGMVVLPEPVGMPRRVQAQVPVTVVALRARRIFFRPRPLNKPRRWRLNANGKLLAQLIVAFAPRSLPSPPAGFGLQTSAPRFSLAGSVPPNAPVDGGNARGDNTPPRSQLWSGIPEWPCLRPSSPAPGFDLGADHTLSRAASSRWR